MLSNIITKTSTVEEEYPFSGVGGNMTKAQRYDDTKQFSYKDIYEAFSGVGVVTTVTPTATVQPTARG